jgi:hypothetical protein
VIGIRRFVELVLDRRSIKQVEKETQEGLDKATDPKKAVANLGSITKGFGASLRTAGRLLAEATATIAGYGVALAKLTERGGQVLGVQDAFTRKTGDQVAAVNELRAVTGGLISDYDLMVGFNRAATLGAAETVEQYGELARTGITLGRALGVDAAFAVESLSLGIGRQSKLILDNLGLIVDAEGATKAYAKAIGKTVEALTAEEKAEAFRSAALEAARSKIAELGGAQETNAQSLQRLITLYTNLRDEIAKLVAQSPQLRILFHEIGNVLETLLLAMQGGQRDQMVEAFKIAGTLAGTVFAQAFFAAVQSIFRGISDLLTPKFLEDHAQFIPVLGVFKSIADLAGEAADSAGETTNALITQGDALRKLLETEAELRRRRSEILDQTQEQNEALATQATLAERVAASTADIAARSADAGRAGMGRNRLVGFGEGLHKMPASLDNALLNSGGMTQEFLDNLDTIESAAQVTALGIQQAFTDALSLVGEEGEGLADVLEAVFRGMASSALTGLAQIATTKVTENIASAVEEVAKGLAAAANPLTAATAPAHFAAAKMHGVAAAKWALLGGVAGAAGAAVGGAGGAGGGGTFRGTDVTGRAVDRIDRGGPDIVIHLDGVDPRNPRHQELVGEASRNFNDAYGGRVRTG